ncbi:hypothetical protein PRIPAC_86857 [Pristionchus pacificus]|uniref:Uncharacterized protein n=1 Tax=Pristionchus pacificus TaxID=54126 RepID=A0A2A6BTW6_PRIPA|nr:hypothetical protein PRIPAC_86857 [Pristionchus pacificus]|eukprot:PDM69297.1 hypothetical protein PRIPAC_47599 [Pristionchus pacificus]
MDSSPLLATQESVNALTKLVEDLHVKLDKLFAAPSATLSMVPTVIEQSQKTTNLSYASIVRAFAESEKIKDKSQRAVLVGSQEKATPQETAQHDEEVLKEIIEATHDKDLKDAYISGSISHRRFPENKAPGRDCELIKFRGPSYRPLPSGYRNLKANENAKSSQQAKVTNPISNQSKLKSNSETISTTIPTVTAKSTAAPPADFVTTRKKEEKPSTTSPSLSTLPTSGGTTAKDERASSLH